jgi:hypothetical protein
MSGCPVPVLEKDQNIQFPLQFDQPFFHFPDYPEGMLNLPVPKALTGLIQDGFKRGGIEKGGVFFTEHHTINVLYSLTVFILNSIKGSAIPCIVPVSELSKALIKVTTAINAISINTRLRMKPPLRAL